MINPDELLCIGYIKRPHGFKGELQIELEKEVVLDKGDFLFFKLDNQFIPYPVNDIKGKDGSILKLDFVEDHDRAQYLSGREVYLESSAFEEQDSLSLVGFELIDQKMGSIGRVEALEELPGQTMLITTYMHRQCYIPFVDAFLLKIDTTKKQIQLDLPEGLLEQ